MGWKKDILFFEQSFEVLIEEVSDLFRLKNLGAVFSLDCIDVISPSADDS